MPHRRVASHVGGGSMGKGSAHPLHSAVRLRVHKNRHYNNKRTHGGSLAARPAGHLVQHQQRVSRNAGQHDG
eukprot:scaffold1450_cov119-Isochrysis_galbana.AAC.1